MKKESNFPNMRVKVNPKSKINLHDCPTHHLTPSGDPRHSPSPAEHQDPYLGTPAVSLGNLKDLEK